MSHFTQIDIEIRDIEALKAACDELGLTLKKNAEARGFGGNHRKGEYVIKLKGPYDIALNSRKDGIYKAETDLWEGHVENELGMKDLAEAVGNAVPLSVTMSEKIKALREWSRNRARPASGGGAGEKTKRKNGDRRKIAARRSGA